MTTMPLKTVLLVDDDESLRKAMSFDFKRRDFQVLEASGGNAAYEIIKSQPVDIVISDIRMPEGDGIDLLKKIRQLNPKLPHVILMSGFSDLKDHQALELGALALFHKPFDRYEIFKVIEQALPVK